MSRPVYSTSLGLAQGVFLAPVTLFTCPGGFVTVLKSITISAGITGGGYSARVVETSSGVVVWQVANGSLLAEPTTYVITQLHDVFYEGQQLEAQCSSVTADFILGGYLLALP